MPDFLILETMLKRVLFSYGDSFKGLSPEVWWLALITLVNRAGTMVIPFLSLYLIEYLNFTLTDVGWIMTAFGFGSLVGTWLGGILTDKLGYYKVMVYSIICTGLLFIGLQFLDTFVTFCLGIFAVILAADVFRPALFVALNAYSKPENKTRSVTLIRLAINLGFSAGPAIGGVIITSLGYKELFWVDGITCILAGLLLLKVLHPKKVKVLDEVKVENPVSAYSDSKFWVFFAALCLFGIVFLQYFSTIPIFYKKAHYLSEFEIGLLLGMNGFVIFLFEMPLIKWLEKLKYSKVDYMIFGTILLGLSLVILNFTAWIGVLVIGMLLMSLGEMITFPFSNSYALDRAKKGKQGQYMALYSMSFSVAHILSHNAGMRLVDGVGFSNTWYLFTVISVVCVFCFMYLLKRSN